MNLTPKEIEEISQRLDCWATTDWVNLSDIQQAITEAVYGADSDVVFPMEIVFQVIEKMIRDWGFRAIEMDSTMPRGVRVLDEGVEDTVERIHRETKAIPLEASYTWLGLFEKKPC